MRRLKLSDLWRGAVGLGGSLVNVLALSLLLQLTLVLAPLQVQWVIDQGVIRADRELIVLLALGFAMLLLVRLAAQLMRGWLITRLTHLLAFEFGRNLFGHMLRLPLDWFAKRHLGDISSRFGSLGPVRDAMTQGLVAVCVDGFMAIAMLAMMFAYDALLAALVVAACGVYFAVRFAQMPALARIAMDEINQQARAESSFLESMRAMPAVRAYSQETGAARSLAEPPGGGNQCGDTGCQVGAGRRRCANVDLRHRDHSGCLFGRQSCARRRAHHRHALRLSQLQGRVHRAVWVNWSGRGWNCGCCAFISKRLADPYCASAELSTEAVTEQPVRGALRVAEVGYRYGEREPWVLRDVNLQVEPGAFIAFTGPSGGGKTTLIKLLMGQAAPSAGNVYVGECSLEGAWLRRYRHGIGCVLQDDALFAGSLAANISLFDEQFDSARFERACHLARIDSLIASLPMGLETPVGDMGAALSGGQVQRLLLARALYRSPDFLFLDEGTAHLDPAMRGEIQEMIANLDCTRVIATHDLSFAEQADRTYEVRGGAVTELSNLQPDGMPGTPTADGDNNRIGGGRPPRPAKRHSPNRGQISSS